MSLLQRHAPARRSAGQRDDGLIPMINIVFLLLIFFMIAGQIAPRAEVLDLPASQSEDALDLAELELSVTADGVLHVDGDTVEAAALEAELAARRVGADTVLVCRADRAAPAAALDPVLRAARALGVKRLQIATERQG